MNWSNGLFDNSTRPGSSFGHRIVSIYRVFQYAETGARVLARIGDMPGPAQWRHVADARDLDTLIGRMRENGLHYWVRELPRTPDTAVIEQHLRRRLVDFFEELIRLLPRRWLSVRHWLHRGGNLIFLKLLINEEQPSLPDNVDPALLEIASMPRRDRNTALSLSGYHRYVDDAAPWHAWWEDLPDACPRLSQYERLKMNRIVSSIRRHLKMIRDASPETSRNLDIQWQWRNELIRDLRQSLCGDRFHVGLVLVYGVLKAMEFERCRAMLVSVSRGWQTPDLLRGVS